MHGRGGVERLMTSYTRVVLLVGLPCVAYIAATGGELVTLITGYNYDEYRPAATVAPIVAVGSIFTALAGLAHTGLAVARRTIYLVLAASIGLAVNVAANVLVIPRYGIVGAAVATPIGTAAYLGATYWWARRYATWRFPVATLVRAAVAAAAGFAVVAVTPLGTSRPTVVVLAALLGAAVYVAVLAVLGERKGGQPLRLTA
jgi:O-antigen/teichoic acid export membrane protein